MTKSSMRPFLVRRESTGFIFNRIWAAIKREALDVVAGGVSTPQDVDEMWKLAFGTEIGPFRAMDYVGLDVVYDIEKYYAAENANLPAGLRNLLRHYIDAGKLGLRRVKVSMPIIPRRKRRTDFGRTVARPASSYGPGLPHLLHDEPKRDDAEASDRAARNLLRIYGIPADEAEEICRRPLPDVDVLTRSAPAKETAPIEISQ